MLPRRLLLLSLASLVAISALAILIRQALADPPDKNGIDGQGSPIIIPYVPATPTPTPCSGCATPAATPITAAFTYQGQLKRTGTPYTGQCDFQFRLYNDDNAASPPISGPLPQNNLQVNEGHFTAALEYPVGFLTGSERWLGIAVRCPAGSGGFTTLTPRQPLTAAPYALSLRPGARIEGSVIGGLVNAVNSGLWNYGFAGEGGAAGVFGRTDTTSFDSAGVIGTGGLTGVMGVAGIGVPNGNGVVGVAYSGTDAWGVYGRTDQGVGVYGRSDSGIGVLGVQGGTPTPGATPAPAVEGRTDSGGSYAYGVLGRVSDTSPGGFSAGVRGINNGTEGNGIGVWGSQDGSGWGVYGQSASGRGVYGTSGGVNGYGGYFTNSGGGVALYGSGNGQGRNETALRVNNSQTNGGMAAYVTNNSQYATAHFYNGSTGEVLYLQNGGTDANGTGGGDFIRAVNEPENDVQFRVTTAGQVIADVGFGASGADFAELLPAKSGLSAGDVLVISEDGDLTRSTQPYQTTVAGVYSTQPGFLGGQPVQGEKAGHVPLAVVGVVPVKATAENGAIRPGDLLTTSSRPGHAMRAGDNPPAGAVVGKALGPLKDGTGVIQMLVVLH